MFASRLEAILREALLCLNYVFLTGSHGAVLYGFVRYVGRGRGTYEQAWPARLRLRAAGCSRMPMRLNDLDRCGCLSTAEDIYRHVWSKSDGTETKSLSTWHEEQPCKIQARNQNPIYNLHIDILDFSPYCHLGMEWSEPPLEPSRHALGRAWARRQVTIIPEASAVRKLNGGRWRVFRAKKTRPVLTDSGRRSFVVDPKQVRGVRGVRGMA